MNLRSMSLALVALLSTAGCVSVQAETGRPAPVASVRSGNAPAAQASTEPSAPAAVHDALGKAEERPRKEKRKRAEKLRAPVRQPEAIAPPARRPAGNRPRHQAPPRPEPRRAHPPRVARPAQPHDMRTVCATGRGVASADIVDLCRATYGR